MDESAKTEAPLALGKWIGRVVAAVILAEGIWGILVSLTRSLLLPMLARVLGVDPHSPLYLGPGEVNVPDLFAAVLQLCVAGIVFLLIRSWAARPEGVTAQRPRKVLPRPASTSISIAPESVPVAAAAQAAAVSRTPVVQPPPSPPAPVPRTVTPQAAATVPRPEPVSVLSAQTPVQPPKVTKPEKPEKVEKPRKPEKPKEVYYNLVGEPINPTEDE
jgi:hypothetical protein